MRRLRYAGLASLLVVSGVMAAPLSGSTASGSTALGFGSPVAPGDLDAYFAIQPDGKTLPPGSGTVAQGKEIYANACAACHGEKLEGVAATGGLALSGGRGTLTQAKPKKTVESYWPYATTLFDYVKRAMPFNAPGSLSADQAYALTAYILAYDKIVPDTAVMDRVTLPAVRMPNRDGFRPYQGPDHRLYH